MSSAENLNNAIATLGPHTGHSSAGVRRAVADLELSWGKFWVSNARATLPDPALAPRYQRYVEWYTRAWMLLPEGERKLATSPADLDASWTALATDTLKQHADSIVQVNESAANLARDIGVGVKTTLNRTAWIMGLGLGGFLLWKFRGRMPRGKR